LIVINAQAKSRWLEDFVNLISDIRSAELSKRPSKARVVQRPSVVQHPGSAVVLMEL
jgi:hypothetical protein